MELWYFLCCHSEQCNQVARHLRYHSAQVTSQKWYSIDNKIKQNWSGKNFHFYVFPSLYPPISSDGSIGAWVPGCYFWHYYHRALSNLSQYDSIENPIDFTLRWRHIKRDCVWNHHPHDCLLNRLFKAQIKENIKAPRHWPLCWEFTGDRWTPRTKGQ